MTLQGDVMQHYIAPVSSQLSFKQTCFGAIQVLRNADGGGGGGVNMSG